MPQLERRAPHEKRHVSQSQVELQALYRLFCTTGGSGAAAKEREAASTSIGGGGSSTSSNNYACNWKQHAGWLALEHAMKQLAGENLLARGTMETRFPLFGVTWERNHVVAIDLSSNGLRGRIPSEISHLRFLKSLKLHNNPELRGAVPNSMYAMPHLRYCYLDGTGLQGALPFQTAHSFEITQFHASGAGATVAFATTNAHGRVRWTADVTEAEMFMMHSSLRALHERPKTPESALELNAHNATGPERTAAAIKLQRIYRTRIERTKFKWYLKSLVQREVDPSTGCEYFVNSRTGEASWEAPVFLAAARQQQRADNNDSVAERCSSLGITDAWQPCDDGNGNTYYWNSVTGESTWEPPVFLSRIYQELKARYGAERSDAERFELFFRDIDKDSTGEISKDEFALLCGDLGLAMSATQLDNVFRDLDTSGDGELSRDEVITWLTRAYT